MRLRTPGRGIPENLINNDNWRIRRRVMVSILFWAVFNVTWLILYGKDTALHQQIALALIAAIVAIVGSYVFGAVWDDNNKRTTLADAPIDPKPSPPSEE